MKRIIAALSIAALAACGGAQGPLTADEARIVMPSADQARIAVPQPSALAGPARGTEAVALQTAEYAADTIALAGAVNLGVVWTLGIVEFIVNLPPTACTGATCTWGPWGGDQPFEVNIWQLTVTRVDDHYVWGLAGQPKSNPSLGFVTFVSGDAFPTAVRHVGNGDFVLDFDAAAKLGRKTTDPAPQTGRIEATYDNRTSPSVAVKFLGTADDRNPAQKVNAAYQFQATATGGDLQVATRNIDTGTRLTLHSRWTATGAGRGDASFLDGATAATYTRSQCWDGNATLFNLVFQVTSPPQPSDTGPETACVFSPAAPPAISAP